MPLTKKSDRRPTCLCERLPFPHRRDWHCADLEHSLPASYHGGNLGCADQDEYDADCRGRARDCNLAARGL